MDATVIGILFAAQVGFDLLGQHFKVRLAHLMSLIMGAVNEGALQKAGYVITAPWNNGQQLSTNDAYAVGIALLCYICITVMLLVRRRRY